MSLLAIIGGTGLASLDTVRILQQQVHNTPFGPTSGPLIKGSLAGREVVFLPRHGNPHAIPPHRINYRANIRALRDIGVESIIGINAVGGITERMAPRAIVLPDQIIDYTWSREHSYWNDGDSEVIHVDFTRPYSDGLRGRILDAAARLGLDLIGNGTYGATQGPRLETAAEIARMEHDGCDIVGMTGMPEAALARELALEYASISLVVNMAAGKTDEEITMEMIIDNLAAGMEDVKRLVAEVVKG